MEYASVEPVLLRDFKEHQDASIQFTKSLIYTTVRSRRVSKKRPGVFIVQLSVRGNIGVGRYLRFFAGENKREKEINLPIDAETVVFSNLQTSGLKGYPEFMVVLELFGQMDEVLYTTPVHVNLLFKRESCDVIDLGSLGSIELIAKTVRQKS